MNEIVFSRKFLKSYKSRIQSNTKMAAKFDQRYALFQQGEKGYPLDDHPLTGKLAGKRAFSIAPDVRVIYEKVGNAVIFLEIGGHNQVY